MNGHGTSCPNPYCGCADCECAVPCTCGLHPVSHNQDTRWDFNDRVLVHTETTTFQPVDHAPPRHAGSSGGGGPGHDHGSSSAAPSTPPTLSMEATNDIAAALAGDSSGVAGDLLRSYSANQSHHGHEGHTSVRSADHKGHKIEIHTTYRVTINDKELAGHFGVDQDGTTHYHGLPNYQQASAVDLVKMVIDQFPDDFPSNEAS